MTLAAPAPVMQLSAASDRNVPARHERAGTFFKETAHA